MKNVNFLLKEILVEITNFCYLNCKHCSVRSPEMHQRIMSFDTLKGIINDFASLGGKEFIISGGEPLSHPKWQEVIDYAKNKGLTVNLYTCGVMDNKTPSFIARKIKSTEVDKVSISLHGSSAHTHESITNKTGSFRRTVKLIENLIKRDVTVRVHFVPMAPNVKELEDVVNYCAKLGVHEISILRFVPQGMGLIYKDELNLNKTEFEVLVKDATEQRCRTDIKVNVGTPLDFSFLINPKYKPKKCTAGVDKCSIRVNGDVIPCPAFSDLSNYVAGNIFSSSLVQIWKNSPAFTTLRTFTCSNLQGRCRSCIFRSTCCGRCPAQRIRENGNIYQGPDPYCFIG